MKTILFIVAGSYLAFVGYTLYAHATSVSCYKGALILAKTLNADSSLNVTIDTESFNFKTYISGECVK